VSLNIKNEQTHELVRQLAALTGQSQTSAVEDAVRRRLAELADQTTAAQADRRWRELRRGLEPFWATISDEDRAATKKFMDEMYDDELGLPR